MEYIPIPNIQLNEDQQKELVNAVNNRKEQLDSYYKPLYDRIRMLRSYRECRNYEKTLFPIIVSEGDTDESRPNVHYPLLKETANCGIAELSEALFGNDDFLMWEAVNPDDKESELLVSNAFSVLRNDTYTKSIERQILEDLYWYGTSPVYITNEGRYNSVPYVVPTFELPIPDVMQVTMSGLMEKDIGTKLIYKEEDVEINGQSFKGVIIRNDMGDELARVTEEEGVSAIDMARMHIEQKMGIDVSYEKIVDYELKYEETYIKGLPRPKILNILNTYIEPASVCDDPDQLGWVFWTFKKTQDIVDNPNFMNLNKMYLQGSPDKLRGTNIIRTKDISSFENTSENYTADVPYVEFKQAYFSHFTFKDGTILRNFLVATVDDEVLVECKPNTCYSDISGEKISKNPLIIHTYYKASGDNIGTSPTHDAVELARTVNILLNYSLDALARSGNRYIFDSSSVDFKTIQGTGAVVEVDLNEVRQLGVNNVNNLFSILPDNAEDAVSIMNILPSFRDQIQQISNTTQPYFQSSKMQTATEIATVQSNASGIVKAILERIAKTYTDMYQRMFDDAVERGIVINYVAQPDGQGNSVYQKFNFGDLRGHKFVPKIVSLNPQVSKAILGQTIEKILTIALQSQNPEILSRVNLSEFTQEWLNLNNLDKPNLVRDDMQAQQWRQQNDLKEQLYALYQQGLLVPVPQPPVGAGGVVGSAPKKGRTSSKPKSQPKK